MDRGENDSKLDQCLLTEGTAQRILTFGQFKSQTTWSLIFRYFKEHNEVVYATKTWA